MIPTIVSSQGWHLVIVFPLEMAHVFSLFLT